MEQPTQTVDFEPEMVPVPEGAFLMGSGGEPEGGGEDPEAVAGMAATAYDAAWERPAHRRHLPDFLLGRTPVTGAQYAAFLVDTDHPRPKRWRGNQPPRGKENFPVVQVTWHDATAYCGWLAAVTGKPYRLPSEAEWEKGARGADGRRYPWGETWEEGRCNSAEAELKGITPVDAYPDGASPYGLLDMAGNVWEWTASLWGTDWYAPAYGYPYEPDDGREDVGVGDAVCRVLRGGSFAYGADFARNACRYKNFPGSYSDGIGFRVALE